MNICSQRSQKYVLALSNLVSEYSDESLELGSSYSSNCVSLLTYLHQSTKSGGSIKLKSQSSKRIQGVRPLCYYYFMLVKIPNWKNSLSDAVLGSKSVFYFHYMQTSPPNRKVESSKRLACSLPLQHICQSYQNVKVETHGTSTITVWLLVNLPPFRRRIQGSIRTQK